MFWLIENTTQLKEFYNKGYDEVFVEPIYLHDNVHPKLTDISLLYIRPIKGRKGFIISINHSEATSIQKKHVISLLKTFKTVFVRNEKTSLYHFPLKTLVDASFNAPLLPEVTTSAHTFLYTLHSNKLDINRIVPIVKHYEKCENIFKQIKDYCYEQNKFYSKISKVFYFIENNGIGINRKQFDKHFELPNDSFNIFENRIFTSYNLHTTTGRPSNSFNTINFAALNKDNHSRKSFIPLNDSFLEFDISAYHPTLASQLVNFNSSNIYNEFAEVAGVDVKQAKELMFRQLYGGIMEEYKDWEFFQKIQTYIDKLWNQWETNDYIECPISKYNFHKKQIENVNPHKLFNYVLQNMETSNNVNIIWDIIKILKDKNTKLVLYTYDAFLFDVDDSEIDTIEEIKQVFSKYKLTTKAKTGYNYEF
jgi:hypothetical protein